MKKKNIICGLVMAGLMGFNPGMPAFAAVDTIDADNVVVTATRNAMNPKDAPGAISIITRQDIEESNARDLVELLREQTGVILNGRSVGGRKTITFRGMNGKHTLMMVNGMRISASNASIGHSDFENNWVPIESIERIEVVRGPLSALYGSEAMGGVINIITKSASTEWSGSIQTKTGVRFDGNDGETLNIGAQVSGPLISDKLSITLSTEYSNEEPAINKDDEKKTEIEGKKVTTGSIGFTYTPSSNHTISLTFNGTDGERENWAVTTSKKYYKTIYDIKKSQVAFNLSSKIGPTDNVLKIYRSSVEKKATKTYESGTVSTSYDEIINDVADFQSTFLLLGSKMTLGGEVRKEELISPTITKLTDDAVHTAFFAQDEIILFDKLSLTGGFRWDHHEAFGAEASPRIYALYKLNKNINLKAGYGHAFNAPTIKQVSADYHAHTGPHEFFGNPDLQPETSDNFEAGVEVYMDRVRAKFFYFHNEIDNLIVWDEIATKQFKAENIDEARTRGLETEIGVDLPYDFNLSVNYMYMDAKDTKNNARLEGKPRHTAGGKLRYEYKPWDMWAALRCDYTGSQLLYDKKIPKDMPAFSLWSFSLGKKLTRHLEIKCGIDNIGDIRLADKSEFFAYEERGRTFWAGLTARF